MSAEQWITEDPAGIDWDVVVIGTGMGGATAGFELARLGRRVLFIEKGPLLHAIDRPQGDGRCTIRVRASTNLGDLDFALPVGAVAGGSTAFYAAALERFSPDDFTPRANFPAVTDCSLPERWPISYDELAPYYERAERLFDVRGTQDPLYRGSACVLGPPPVQSARDDHFQASFTKMGLHPYRVHVGCRFLPGCDECRGTPCRRDCKRDAAWTCLIPALSQHGARILPDCEVLRLEADTERVREVVCRRGGQELRIRATTVLLAAGAFITPALLLRSSSADWPDGLANKSGLVGRNLMFHGGDFFAISPLERVSCAGLQKTLALNDFYFVDGKKLGTFQTLGVTLEIGRIMQYLRETNESSTAWWRFLFASRPIWWRKLTSPLIRLVAQVAFHVFNFKSAGVWVSIVEDLPYRENRVWPDPDRDGDIRMEYRYSDELKMRVESFRGRLRKALGRHRMMVLSPVNKLDFPHVCGTCRFGDDPRDSVLDRSNRAHGVRNLYVVDASFFPSSGGTNPSLTIAANALRVAEVIAGTTHPIGYQTQTKVCMNGSRDKNPAAAEGPFPPARESG